MPAIFSPEGNPFSGLAAMPAETAVLYEAMRFVYVLAIGAYAWDWLCSMGKEYRMIKRDGFSLTTAMYLASRIFTQAFTVLGFIYLVVPLPNCHDVLVTTAAMEILGTFATSYLFLLRVKAIFHDSRPIFGAFVFLWLALISTSLLVPFSINGVRIPESRNCIVTDLHPRAASFGVIHMVNNTLIFVSISWKLLAMQRAAVGQQGSTKFDTIKGRGMSQVSRVLWSSGQLYFFTTLFMNIINMVFVLTPSLDLIYHFMLLTANDALENAMACRIFRQLKFDARRKDYIDTVLVPSAIAFQDLNRSTTETRFDANGERKLGDRRSYYPTPMEVNVHRVVEADMGGAYLGTTPSLDSKVLPLESKRSDMV